MPKHRDAQEVYKVMEAFRDKCLIGDRSLLWDEPGVWTLDHLMAVKRRFVDNPMPGGQTFWEKAKEQFRGQSIEFHKIFADAFIVYTLPSTFMKPATKWSYVEKVVKMVEIPPPNPKTVQEALSQGFAPTTAVYHSKYGQFWFLFSFAIRVKQVGAEILSRPWDTALLADQCLQEFPQGDRAYDMRHALLHMLYPDEFEAMISNDHKRRVIAAFLPPDQQESPDSATPEGRILLDRDVAKARRAMIEKYKPEVADFYAPRMLSIWNSKSTVDPDIEEVDPLPYDTKLAELVGPLKENGQLILYGPPGTGKTYYAMKLAETVAATENITGESRASGPELLDSLKSGAKRQSRAWLAVAAPSKLRWADARPGTTIDLRYGQVRANFEQAEIGDTVFVYRTSPTGAIAALGHISTPLRDGTQKQTLGVTLSHILARQIPSQALAEHPVLKDSEPVTMAYRGTLFKLGAAEARELLAMVKDLNPAIDVHIRSGTDSAIETDVPYLRLCAFHPAYGYEDFIEGYRPDLTSDGQPYYRVVDGIFKLICNDARQQPDKTFVLIIDEINRGNIPRIFGELITLIDTDKRWKPGTSKQFSTVLPTSHETFAVPDNLYIIGTMNTADKSIALFDTALRRRFAFREMLPDPNLLADCVIEGISLDKLMLFLNKRITKHLDKNLQIGHAYFMDGTEAVKTPRKLAAKLRDKVFPLLQDYCYDDYGTLSQILGEHIVDRAQNAFKHETTAAGKDEELLEAVRKLLEGDNG